MKCPICEKEIIVHTTDYDGHILCEEYVECKDDYHRYYYRFGYGAWEEIIGHVIFIGSHNDTEDIRKLRNKQYNLVLELEKEYYNSNKS